jgi:hypothetical protein
MNTSYHQLEEMLLLLVGGQIEEMPKADERVQHDFGV